MRLFLAELVAVPFARSIGLCQGWELSSSRESPSTKCVLYFTSTLSSFLLSESIALFAIAGKTEQLKVAHLSQSSAHERLYVINQKLSLRFAVSAFFSITYDERMDELGSVATLNPSLN